MKPIEVRQAIEDRVRRELFGPSIQGAAEGTPWEGGVVDPALKPYYQEKTGEEVLLWSSPLERYCVGILHGRVPNGGGNRDAEAKRDNDAFEATQTRTLTESLESKDVNRGAQSSRTSTEGYALADADDDDFDLAGATRDKPSSLGFTFRVNSKLQGALQIRFSCGTYEKVEAPLKDEEKFVSVWKRTAFELSGELKLADEAGTVVVNLRTEDGAELPCLRVRAFSRPIPDGSGGNHHFVSLVAENIAEGTGAEKALFQCRLSVEDTSGQTIVPYGSSIVRGASDDLEVESLKLLYRDKVTYAVGHGCAVDWTVTDEGIIVESAVLPSHEVPAVSPDVKARIGGEEKQLRVSMAELASLSPLGVAQVEQLLGSYEDWIDQRRAEAAELSREFRDAAFRHVKLCEEALSRMRKGWHLVHSDADVAEAFKLANQAINIQQVRSRITPRDVSIIGAGPKARIKVESPASLDRLESPNGSWRPFQIAFLLASVEDIVDPEAEFRSAVDIVFFPTGGGKTEAYLGVASFSAFYRRLVNPTDSGTDCLMRYTLRLLTTQQFLRAASLLAAMDQLRISNAARLGSDPFSIGVWLGRDTTPNTRNQALSSLKNIERGKNNENPFLLTKCPWCGARLDQFKSGRVSKTPGYAKSADGTTVVFVCPDVECPFSSEDRPLPVKVIDEDIYESPPTLLIGTVDKFAMMAFTPQARAIFGRRKGESVNPPNLIIQDELHLISGPLGSMVGLYETAIGDLCSRLTEHGSAPAKLICSTATIRRYPEQVMALYGRKKNEAKLFPPLGLVENDSFFSQPARDRHGEPLPGKRYLGIFSSTLASMQSLQVRVASASLMAANELRLSGVDDRELDPYWTNLNFFNSLRELGNTVSLLDSDVPDNVKSVANYTGIEPRYPRNRFELTSRRSTSEIPKALDELAVRLPDDQTIDICLASNIIEVGVDVDRLGLMTIVGQPKTVSQYIQVSGRVGRDPVSGPGLVMTVFGPRKPRDRSHYEKFKTFHQALYAQVEPTSVTPFSLPVLKRALHGALVAIIRQNSGADLAPYPFPKEEFKRAAHKLLSRAESVGVDEEAIGDMKEVIDRRFEEWDQWGKTEWDAKGASDNLADALMRYASGTRRESEISKVWDVPSSMRNVDGECRLIITDSSERKGFSWMQ